MRDASKLKVLHKTVLPREGCKMSRVHLCGRPWGAMPNPENRLRVKPATSQEKLRGNPLQTSVGTQGNPRRTVKSNFGKGKCRTCRKHTEIRGKPVGNPQETRRKPAGSLQETCRKPREDLEAGKPRNLNPKETRQKPFEGNVRRKLVRGSDKLVAKLWKPAGNTLYGKLGNPTSREHPARNHRANANPVCERQRRCKEGPARI